MDAPVHVIHSHRTTQDQLSAVQKTFSAMGKSTGVGTAIGTLNGLSGGVRREIVKRAKQNSGIFGEMRVTSICELVQFLRDACNMTESSSFIDIGFGQGKIMAAVATLMEMELIYGVELVLANYTKTIPDMITAHPHFANPNQRMGVVGQNVLHMTSLNPFTHVYMFSCGMPLHVYEHVEQLARHSQTVQYMVIFFHPGSFRDFQQRLVVEYGWTLVVKMAGRAMIGSGESKTAYIYHRRSVSDDAVVAPTEMDTVVNQILTDALPREKDTRVVFHNTLKLPERASKRLARRQMNSTRTTMKQVPEEEEDGEEEEESVEETEEDGEEEGESEEETEEEEEKSEEENGKDGEEEKSNISTVFNRESFSLEIYFDYHPDQPECPCYIRDDDRLDCLQVCETENMGKGVFSTRMFNAKDDVGFCEGKVVGCKPRNTEYTFELENDVDELRTRYADLRPTVYKTHAGRKRSSDLKDLYVSNNDRILCDDDGIFTYWVNLQEGLSVLHYMNHSVFPNCQFHNGQCTTTRPVSPGEQLYWNYGLHYWSYAGVPMFVNAQIGFVCILEACFIPENETTHGLVNFLRQFMEYATLRRVNNSIGKLSRGLKYQARKKRIHDLLSPYTVRNKRLLINVQKLRDVPESWKPGTSTERNSVFYYLPVAAPVPDAMDHSAPDPDEEEEEASDVASSPDVLTPMGTSTDPSVMHHRALAAYQEHGECTILEGSTVLDIASDPYQMCATKNQMLLADIRCIYNNESQYLTGMWIAKDRPKKEQAIALYTDNVHQSICISRDEINRKIATEIAPFIARCAIFFKRARRMQRQAEAEGEAPNALDVYSAFMEVFTRSTNVLLFDWHMGKQRIENHYKRKFAELTSASENSLPGAGFMQEAEDDNMLVEEAYCTHQELAADSMTIQYLYSHYSDGGRVFDINFSVTKEDMITNVVKRLRRYEKVLNYVSVEVLRLRVEQMLEATSTASFIRPLINILPENSLLGNIVSILWADIPNAPESFALHTRPRNTVDNDCHNILWALNRADFIKVACALAGKVKVLAPPRLWFAKHEMLIALADGALLDIFVPVITSWDNVPTLNVIPLNTSRCFSIRSLEQCTRNKNSIVHVIRETKLAGVQLVHAKAGKQCIIGMTARPMQTHVSTCAVSTERMFVSPLEIVEPFVPIEKGIRDLRNVLVSFNGDVAKTTEFLLS